jgi:hypothetical protein
MMAVRPAAAALGLVLLAGCGYVGEPLPPLLHIPVPVADLTAVQRGARVIVEFSVSRMTTESTLLREAPEIDLRGGPGPSPWNEHEWAAQARQLGEGPVENGRARYETPVNGWPGRDIVFGVRVLGPGGRSAGWSDFVTIAVVPPLARPEDVRAEAVAGGVRVAWQGKAPLYRIFRRAPGEQAFTHAADTADAAWTDAATEYGRAYEYVVQGIAKTGTGEAESDPSDPVRIEPKDRFPPAVPAGLTAVVSTAGIELAWERNTEPDFSAYRVWRAGAGEELAPIGEAGQTPSYADRTAAPGQAYRYAVSAIDMSGNESALSAAVEVGAR